MRKYIYGVFVFFFTGYIIAQEKEMSLSMQEAIDYAIKNSYDNKVSLNDIEAAKKKKWETTTIGLPQINGVVDYQNWLKQQVQLVDFNSDGVDEELIFTKKQTTKASVTLSQLLFDGSYLVGLQSAKTYLKISEQAKEKTELATREAIINAYGNVLVTEKSIDILENNKKILEKNLNETQKTYDNGLTELENVEQLQITLGNVDSNLRNAERLKEIAYQMLNVSLGNSIETKLTLTSTLDNLVVDNTDLSLLATQFNIDNHIDFKIAQNDRESKRLLMKLEQSKYLPTLSAFVNYGVTAFSDSFTFLDSNQRWLGSSLLGVSLNVPIFSSFGRNSKVKQAKIALENADIRLEEAKQKLNLQVERAKSEYQLGIENHETAKKNLALAERIEKKQQVKFFEGISSSFDLLQAQNQLYTQQNNYVQSMLNVIAKKAQLENALNIPLK
ncbi:TolC family protein [Tenacibaculum sp. 1B UA]|uniref:TolC family protein n=1 Tax=unclassified Tenacibaculum TaxID=2635139 RepID=UPI0026E39F30|nr:MULTISPECIES: TolC family protein [unclassified Tenacibaculum]MDO6675412.1 TolC family protein [Tenacibaculum sp. 1_MG-2023]MDX8553929.1 TolC family protein [Tenacibaculum sp. 1B UA]